MKKNISLFFKISSVVLFLLSIVLFSFICYFNYTLPNKYYVDMQNQLELKSTILSSNTNSGNPLTSASTQNNMYSLDFMGMFPIKQVLVEEQPDVYLNVSGSPFGLKMFSKGAIVVGLESIQTANSNVNPWQNSNIRKGDIVVKANGKDITRNSDLAIIIENSNGKEISLELLRGDETIKTTLTPVLCSLDNSYKSGVWVRDSTAGIGTITYIDPQNHTFAGLGHGICDSDTGQIVPVGSGEICDVSITNITKGKSGTPGELMGIFTSDISFGNILLNNQTGVYGKIFSTPTPNTPTYKLEHKQNVTKGNASIICCFDGQNPKEYSIEIESISYNQKSEIKNLSIKVTDSELLALTGGIVQGMSGTPIIQNGKLVGAVTHVFVNDSTRGYGIFAENMYTYSSDITSSVDKENVNTASVSTEVHNPIK